MFHTFSIKGESNTEDDSVVIEEPESITNKVPSRNNETGFSRNPTTGMQYFDLTVNHFLGRKGSKGKTQEFIE